MKTYRQLTLIITLFFLGFIILGCSSSDDEVSDNNYFLKFKADGELIEFSLTTVYPAINTANNYYQYSLNGGDGNSGFTINIVNNVPIANGQNLDSTPVVDDQVPQCYLSYALPDDDTYTYSSWITPPSSSNNIYFPISVNISEVTNESISGTFSGTLGELFNESTTISITEGSFKVNKNN